VPNLKHSFRLSSAEKIVGRVTQDHESAIVGRLGEDAPMFPCVVRVKGTLDRTFNYRLAGYWEAAPFLAGAAAAISSARWEGSGGLITIRATSRISLKGMKEPVVLSNTFASQNPQTPIYSLVVMPLQSLVLNPFKEVEIAGVEFDIEIQKGIKAAVIESLQLDRVEAEPGEKVNLTVGLREFQGERLTRRIEFQVPKDAQPGTVASVLVCDSAATMAQRMGQDPGFFQPRDFASLLAEIQTVAPSTALYVHATFQKHGLRYAAAMPQLPDCVMNTLVFGAEAGLVTPLTEDVSMRVETPWVISGQQQAVLAIREPRAR
jgi:hypothetical protein